MVSFIDSHKGKFGVEPICKSLPIAPATYYEQKARQRDFTRLPERKLIDMRLKEKIQRIWKENFAVYGVHKVWIQLEREGTSAARCTVARLMRELGLRGAVRGKKCFTTVSEGSNPRPPDLVDRKFRASRPNQLWVADFTFVATWNGFVFVAFVIDVFARKIVGWRAAGSMKTDLVLDALEQALHERTDKDGLVHHSDRGVQYLSIRYTERLGESGIQASVGTTGDSYDNAMAESIIGLFKTEVIRRRGPWRNLETVEFATLEWVDWFNNRRLLEPIGNIPPRELEEMYYSNLENPAEVAGLKQTSLR
jgi:transposase InsO family protein